MDEQQKKIVLQKVGVEDYLLSNPAGIELNSLSQLYGNLKRMAQVESAPLDCIWIYGGKVNAEIGTCSEFHKDCTKTATLLDLEDVVIKTPTNGHLRITTLEGKFQVDVKDMYAAEPVDKKQSASHGEPIAIHNPGAGITKVSLWGYSDDEKGKPIYVSLSADPDCKAYVVESVDARTIALLRYDHFIKELGDIPQAEFETIASPNNHEEQGIPWYGGMDSSSGASLRSGYKPKEGQTIESYSKDNFPYEVIISFKNTIPAEKFPKQFNVKTEVHPSGLDNFRFEATGKNLKEKVEAILKMARTISSSNS